MIKIRFLKKCYKGSVIVIEPALKKEIIMENYLNPLNRETITDSKYIKVNSNSETCIDNINLYILFDNDKIVDLYFDGEACAISTSATSIMIKLLLGKSLDEVKNLIKNYYNMIEAKDYDAELLQEACCYDDIYKQQNRIGCATIPWKGIEKAIKEYEENK